MTKAQNTYLPSACQTKTGYWDIYRTAQKAQSVLDIPGVVRKRAIRDSDRCREQGEGRDDSSHEVETREEFDSTRKVGWEGICGRGSGGGAAFSLF